MSAERDAEIAAADEWFRKMYAGSEQLVTVVIERPSVRRERRRSRIRNSMIYGGVFLAGLALFVFGALDHSVPLFIGGLALMVAAFMGFGFWIARSGS